MRAPIILFLNKKLAINNKTILEETMNKSIHKISLILMLFISVSIISAQSVKLGPRLTGNLNIYNQDRLNVNFNGIGIGIGGTVDISFNQTLGVLANLTVFDMKNISATQTSNNVTTEVSHSLSYLSFDPLFKAEFSGFYVLGGASIAIKLSSSTEITQTNIAGGNPTIQNGSNPTNSVKFDLAAGTGYNFPLAPNLFLGTDLMVYIPLTNTFDFTATSNSTLSLKLGASLKFRI
jgi:hypothetical protein